MTDPTIPDPTRTAEAFRQDAARRHEADTARRAAEAAEGTEGEEVSRLATHKDPTLADPDARTEAAGGGVQWVRPTDLAARAGGAVVDRGAKWNAMLHEAALEGIREGRAQLQERLARRQDELEPAVTSPGRELAPVAGRTGVSR